MSCNISAQHNAPLINLFLSHGIREIHNSNEIIFIKDEPAKYLYFIEKGSIRVYIPYRNGDERTLCYFYPGTIIGEEAFGTPPVRIVCTNSLSETRLYKLSASNLLSLAQKDNLVIPNLLSFFMKKITLLHSWIFYSQFKKNEAKIACLIYTLSKQNAKINLSHEQIAAVTGMTHVTATRILDTFSKKGLISSQYKSLKVLKEDELKEIFDYKEFF